MFRMLRQHAAPIARSQTPLDLGGILNGMRPITTLINTGLSKFNRSSTTRLTACWDVIPRCDGTHFCQTSTRLLNNSPCGCYKNTLPSFKMYHTSAMQSFGLEEFRDPIPRQQREMEPVGRSWSAAELRRKSYEDLHKLWYVLYKERNMLLTEQQLSRRKGLNFPQPERMKKVRKSMGAIKHVLGERKREHLFRIKAAREEQISSDDNDEPLPQSA